MRLFILLFLMAPQAVAEKVRVRVGSKIFTESYVLAEILAQKLEELPEVIVERKFGLGATGITLQALANDEIDICPEYTGTLAEVFLKNLHYQSLGRLRQELELQKLTISDSMGFNNTYALAVPAAFAEKNALYRISDLKKISHPRVGFTHEFIRRSDGWNRLRVYYDLPNFPRKEMEHNLAYQGIAAGKLDLMDVYSTDAKISEMNLRTLKDDQNFFPRYDAVVLARKEFAEKHPQIWAHLRQLENSISEDKMIYLNSLVDIKKGSFADAATDFFGKSVTAAKGLNWRWLKATPEHIFLVLLPLGFAILIGVPLGFLSFRTPWLGRISILSSSVVQTIPSLALLCFFIPLLGIGKPPALLALFFYSLLPILLATHHGLKGIDPKLRETASALGLSGWYRLKKIDFPLAFPSILTGIKTSTVLAIGTATLAALIGAGGYGSLIVMGLAINDLNVVLEGAIPAAAMALVAQFIFSIVEKRFISKGLRYGGSSHQGTPVS